MSRAGGSETIFAHTYFTALYYRVS
jgi:hypothetical protein